MDVPYKTIASPSNVIKTFNKTIMVMDATYSLTLITMKRSFLILINNGDLDHQHQGPLIHSFMSEHSSLRGLSLAIGGHSTCLVAAENSVASETLASRLSAALNRGGPVYVVNNAKASDTASLYEKVFQFIRQSVH